MIVFIMRLNNSILSFDYCWIYIARECKPPQQFHIGAAIDLPQLLNDNAQKVLLYYRQFPNVLDGLAHKLLLAEMNRTSLTQLIRGMNPEMRDLNNDFKINNTQ